jgi:hypothetical protein
MFLFQDSSNGFVLQKKNKENGNEVLGGLCARQALQKCRNGLTKAFELRKMNVLAQE